MCCIVGKRPDYSCGGELERMGRSSGQRCPHAVATHLHLSSSGSLGVDYWLGQWGEHFQVFSKKHVNIAEKKFLSSRVLVQFLLSFHMYTLLLGSAFGVSLVFLLTRSSDSNRGVEEHPCLSSLCPH